MHVPDVHRDIDESVRSALPVAPDVPPVVTHRSLVPSERRACLVVTMAAAS